MWKQENFQARSLTSQKKQNPETINGMLQASCGVYDYYHVYIFHEVFSNDT